MSISFFNEVVARDTTPTEEIKIEIALVPVNTREILRNISTDFSLGRKVNSKFISIDTFEVKVNTCNDFCTELKSLDLIEMENFMLK